MHGNSNVEGDDVRMEQLLTDHYTGHTIDGFIKNLRGQGTTAALILERKGDNVIAAVLEAARPPGAGSAGVVADGPRGYGSSATTPDKLAPLELNASYPEHSIGRAMLCLLVSCMPIRL